MGIAEVRALIATTLAEFGFTGSQPLAEIVLLHDGYHVGWRFEFERVGVVWLFDPEQVQFLDQDSKLIGVVSIARGAVSRAA